MSAALTLPPDYDGLLRDLKARIAGAQVRAAVAVNRELLRLYWEMGREIARRQDAEGWGSETIDRLGRDLSAAFPGTTGFSRRNLYLMRSFYLAYPGEEVFVQQPVAQIPWGHNVVLLQKVKDEEERLWYASETVANGWSRAVLVHQIETGLYARQVTAAKTTNFDAALPPAQSDLARAVLKDPYVFDFLSLEREAKERDLEQALLGRIRDFLLELGAGFAFMGSQYHVEVDGQDFYIDLLFYHHRLRCLVAIDLKMDDFRPEYAGKMNFYLSALDDLVRQPGDGPSLGIVLCKGKSRTVAEYALRDLAKPIGVSEYRLTHQLPAPLQEALPAPGALERVVEAHEEARGAEERGSDSEENI